MMRNNLTRPLLLLLLILSLGSGCRKQDSAAEMEQSKPAPGSYYKTLELLNEKPKSIYRLAVTPSARPRIRLRPTISRIPCGTSWAATST